MKRILFMSEEEARTTLYCAGLAGDYEFYVVGNIEKNQTIQFHPYCKKFINLRNELELSENTQPLVNELIEIINNESIDLLLPVSITCMMVIDKHMDQVLQHVKITAITNKTCVDLLDHKLHFYQFCKENDIAHPESKYIEKSEDIRADNPGIDYPLLIKPVLGAGGFNTLVFVKNQKEMDEFLQKPADKKEGYFPALLQEYFEGEDIDFNGFSINGDVIASSVMKTDFYDKDPDLYFTYFVENNDVLELGNKILRVSKYSGPTNIDMRIRASDGKLMLIELNPRYWARVDVSLMDGMNFLEIGIKAALGEKVRSVSRCPRKRWISSFTMLARAIVLYRDLNYIKYFFYISFAQTRASIFNKLFRLKAKYKLRKLRAS